MPWRDMIHFVVFIAYAVCTLCLAAYALHHFILLYWLARYGIKAARQAESSSPTLPPGEDWPCVTTHIPLYNEAEVAQRVIDAVASMEYPRHQILVLDDSADDTRPLVDAPLRR